jgi:integrase/recombinase XerC
MVSEMSRFDKWLQRRSPHACTHIHYIGDLELFFAWAGKPFPAITIRDVDAYVAHCQHVLGNSPGTVNRKLTALRSFYTFLDLELDDAPPNPVIPKRHFVRRGEQLPRVPREADVQRLFAAIEAAGDVRDRAMFLAMHACGLRVSEVRKLSMADLVLHPGFGSLPRLLVHGKRNKQRCAYLSAEMVAALRAWLDVRAKLSSQRDGLGDPLFLNRYGGRLTVTGIQLRLHAHCRAAGVWITCHQLRHAFASGMLQAGMRLASIQRLLGHASLRTTQVYLHISDPQLQADYEAAAAQVARRLEEAKDGGQR